MFDNLTWAYVLGGAACLFLMISAGLWFWIRALLGRMRLLSAEMTTVGRGNVTTADQRISWHGGHGAVDALAESIDGMLARLAERNHALMIYTNRQRSLLDSLPDGFCRVDRLGGIVQVLKRPDRFPEVPGLEDGGHFSQPAFSPSDCALYYKAVERSFAEGKPQLVNVVCTVNGAEPLNFEMRVNRADADSALLLIRDTSAEVRERAAREEMEARLVKAGKLESLGTLSAGIAHDFNNVMTIMRNAVTLQESDPLNNTSKFFMTLKQVMAKGHVLTQELMDVSGNASGSFQSVSPNSLVLDNEELIDGVIAPNISLELDLGENLPLVEADLMQFWKVIINLLKNASESINGVQGNIRLSTYPLELTEADRGQFFALHPFMPGKGVVFEVKDSGPGIPPEMIDRIFEPFVSSKASGRGLGLSTVFGIVDAHEGCVAVESVLGQGATFKVWMPAADDAQPSSPAKSATPAISEPMREGSDSPAPLGAFTVLLVEDDPLIRMTAAMLVRSLGIKAITAETARQALSFFRKHSDEVRLVMLDAQLGQIHTTRLFSLLRSANPDIPIIIVSGYGEIYIKKVFASVGRYDFLGKPYTRDDLAAALHPYRAVATSPEPTTKE